MTTLGDRIERSGAAVAALMVVAAVALGAALGLATKAALWLYSFVKDVVWEWLPETVGLDAQSFLFMAVILVGGGLLVGLGQKVLGYHPEPLEEAVKQVREGHGVDYRTIPKVLANTLAALGAGAPLGPEAGLIAVIGGIYFWAKARMEAMTALAYGLLTGKNDADTPGAWRYAPTLIVGVVLVVVFHALPGGPDLSFVPPYEFGGDIAVLAMAVVAGAAGGVLGLVATRLQDRVRDLRLFDRSPLLVGPVGGLIVAVLAVPSTLVLFSGMEEMSVLFTRRIDGMELLYAGAAKLVAMLVVIAAGWKGGTIFPLMFIAAALAVGVADVLELEPVVLYAAAIAGAVAGALRSVALGVIVALLVVPASLLMVLVVGAAAAAIVLRAAARRTASIEQSGPSTLSEEKA